LDPSTYSYWNSTFQNNRNAPVVSDGYSTDFISNYSLGFIEQAKGSNRPFFIGIAPIAPHAKTAAVEGSSIPAFTDPVPAPRHANKFPNAKVPRGENFNPDTVRLLRNVTRVEY
jgi:arylsulfatase